MEPNIRNTLNSQFKLHGHINDMIDCAFYTGYPFIEWNGRVYKIIVDEERKIIDSIETNILYEDLK